MTSTFIPITLDSATSFFLASNPYEIYVNVSITTSENLQHLKDTIVFSSFLVCYNRNTVFLTSDLLPNISLVVGQSSVNILLALRGR